jgi:hypothetical protein
MSVVFFQTSCTIQSIAQQGKMNTDREAFRFSLFFCVSLFVYDKYNLVNDKEASDILYFFAQIDSFRPEGKTREKIRILSRNSSFFNFRVD